MYNLCNCINIFQSYSISLKYEKHIQKLLLKMNNLTQSQRPAYTMIWNTTVFTTELLALQLVMWLIKICVSLKVYNNNWFATLELCWALPTVKGVFNTATWCVNPDDLEHGFSTQGLSVCFVQLPYLFVILCQPVLKCCH